MKRHDKDATRQATDDRTPELPTEALAGGPKAAIPDVLPILPLRETVVFPGTLAPLAVGRPKSLKMLQHTQPQSRIIGLFTQQDPESENPGAGDLHEIGTAAAILKLARDDDEGAVTVLVHGLRRIRLRRLVQEQPYLRGNVEIAADVVPAGKMLEAAYKSLRESSMELAGLSAAIPEEMIQVIQSVDQPGQLADFLAANLDIGLESMVDLLEELDVAKRVRRVQILVARQLEIAKLQLKIHQDVQSTITETQRRGYLREQLKAIQRELGEEEGGTEQVAQLREKIKAGQPPSEVLEEAERELGRLEALHPANPEASVIVTYLETLAELPWNRLSEDHLDLERAQTILDRDHHDLDKVKRRLIEYLAVRKLNPENRGPILCLVGPPGVGKTSLGQSVADAMGRQFVRMSLGGIRDEAEVRGHRRTYIGSMPGRIIQEIRRAGTRNPVMMLDEIDKLGADFRGDPASALLELLDPRQNSAFVDRYLDVPFDLSQVLFIATANYMDPVPPALRDRMEIIEIPGYTDGEKLEIARRYLVPRQLRENGLKRKQCRFTAKALRRIIDAYTREAGVRGLERKIGAVCRSVAANVAVGERRAGVKVDEGEVRERLGPAAFVREVAGRKATPGVVTGLAYTPVGGEVLFVEATRYPGRGEVQLTGQIGDVMRESAATALSLVKSRAEALGLGDEDFSRFDLHVHVPAGAVPKDGPSAGVAMFTALVSLLRGVAVPPDLAMTGEITLRGLVLPIGGVKEKTLAAMRAGIRTVILPRQNEKDLPDMAEEARKKLKIIFAADVDELLDAAFPRRRRRPKPKSSGA